jgi:signal transduction histidine kinase
MEEAPRPKHLGQRRRLVATVVDERQFVEHRATDGAFDALRGAIAEHGLIKHNLNPALLLFPWVM